MQIEINKVKYELYFGFDFIDFINTSGLSIQGVQLGVGGMQFLTLGITQKSPSTLRLIIKAATVTLSNKPSDEDITKYIEDLLMNDLYEDQFDEIIEELGKHVLVLREMGITKKELEKSQALTKQNQN